MGTDRKVLVGPYSIEGWMHIDSNNQDIQKYFFLPYKKCSVSEIMVAEVLEHIPLESIVQVINELRRVLIPGGRLTIIFPDIVKAAFLYKRSVISFEEMQLAVIGNKTALAMDKIENLLLMRFTSVVEKTFLDIYRKKIWETILVAEKRNEN